MKYRVDISVDDNIFTEDETRQIENFFRDYADQFGIPAIGTMVWLDFLNERYVNTLSTFIIFNVTIRMDYGRSTVRIDIASESNVRDNKLLRKTGI